MIAFSLAADFKGSSSWGRMDFFLFATITSWLLVIARLVSFCCIVFDAISIFKLAIDFTIERFSLDYGKGLVLVLVLVLVLLRPLVG